MYRPEILNRNGYSMRRASVCRGSCNPFGGAAPIRCRLSTNVASSTPPDTARPAMSGVTRVSVQAATTDSSDRTDLPGFYVAMGSSGNQVKNAASCEHTGRALDLGAFPRERAANAESSGTAMG